MPPAFSRYELRTTDPAAARSFYASIALADLDITSLPEPARAAGAPAHWLGHVTGDLERVLAAGAERIRGNIVRDPVGAVLAVAVGPPSPSPRVPVVWHQLNARDVVRARAFYAEAFGWTDAEPADVTFLEIAPMQRGIHDAWLFHFGVEDLDATIATVEAAGGLVAGVFDLPDGDRLAVCDDPQGAFVGFREKK
jgi:uncharacterized protein